MNEPKQFEDTFVHDSSTPYEEEDEDLGPDEEFSEKPKRPPSTRYKRINKEKLGKKTTRIVKPKKRSFASLFYMAIIIGILIYIFKPELFHSAMKEVTQRTSQLTQREEKQARTPNLMRPPSRYEDKKPSEAFFDETRPVLPEYKEREKLPDQIPLPPLPVKKEAPPQIITTLPAAKYIPLPDLKPRGELPALRMAAQENSRLKDALNTLTKMPLSHLDAFRASVEHIIFLWAGVENLPDEKGVSERKIAVMEKAAGKPLRRSENLIKVWNKYVQSVSFDLFAQTIAKGEGIPIFFEEKNGELIIKETPLKTMAVLYPKLDIVMSQKVGIVDKLRTIEPASSFFIRLCKEDFECLASYDLMMESFGLNDYIQMLQDTPEQVYDL